MNLSDYSILVKPYIQRSLLAIQQEGKVLGYNHKIYTNETDFLDDSIVSIVEYILSGTVEKNIDLSECFRITGIIDGYLSNTDILGKVVKDRSPLGFLRR